MSFPRLAFRALLLATTSAHCACSLPLDVDDFGAYDHTLTRAQVLAHLQAVK